MHSDLRHELSHLGRDLQLLLLNVWRARSLKGARAAGSAADGSLLVCVDETGRYTADLSAAPATGHPALTLRPAQARDLSAISELRAQLELPPLPDWIRRTWRLRAGALLNVCVGPQGELSGYDGLIFNAYEWHSGFIHELGPVIAPAFKGRGLALCLRRFTRARLEGSFLKGISTLINPGELAAMRAAQLSGFAIIKMAAKPRAYYLTCRLHPHKS